MVLLIIRKHAFCSENVLLFVKITIEMFLFLYDGTQSKEWMNRFRKWWNKKKNSGCIHLPWLWSNTLQIALWNVFLPLNSRMFSNGQECVTRCVKTSPLILGQIKTHSHVIRSCTLKSQDIYVTLKEHQVFFFLIPNVLSGKRWGSQGNKLAVCLGASNYVLFDYQPLTQPLFPTFRWWLKNLTFQLLNFFFIAVEKHLFLMIWWTVKENNCSSLWYSLIFLFFKKDGSILREERKIWLYVFYMASFRKDQVSLCASFFTVT